MEFKSAAVGKFLRKVRLCAVHDMAGSICVSIVLFCCSGQYQNPDRPKQYI